MSPAERLALLTPNQRAQVLSRLSLLEQREFPWAWRDWWARPDQLAPAGDWLVWLALAGRGWGKTRTGVQWVRERVERQGARRVGIIGRTAEEARKVLVEGPSGVLACSPPWARPVWEPGKKQLTWPGGATGIVYSADKPDQLRGPQHDTLLADELAAWRYPEAWDMAVFGLRAGNDPRAAVLTTPRPLPIVRELLADPDTAAVRGTTYDNLANLPPKFVAYLRRRYEGSRLGRQELLAELLDDTPGALWTRAIIERAREKRGIRPPLVRIVVGIDPATTAGEDADETGIIVAGKDARGHAYVLEDLSGHHTPAEWGRLAVGAYREWKADRIVAETNQGGDMVEQTIRIVDPNASYRGVHVRQGKRLRAEPVSALYEQAPGRVHHVGAFPQLEDQMCTWLPDDDMQSAKKQPSPDRIDALVHALTDLVVEALPDEGIFELYRQRAAKKTLDASNAAPVRDDAQPRTPQ